MEKKITKKENIKTLLAMKEVQANKDCVAFLENELTLLENKKNGGNGEKARKKLAELNVNLTAIKEYLGSCVEPQTATEIMKNCEALRAEAGELFSIQKVTSLITKLCDSKEVVRTEVKKDKKKATVFSLADAETIVENSESNNEEKTVEEMEK